MKMELPEIGRITREEKRRDYLHREYLACRNPLKRAVLKREWRLIKRKVELMRNEMRLS